MMAGVGARWEPGHTSGPGRGMAARAGLAASEVRVGAGAGARQGGRSSGLGRGRGRQDWGVGAGPWASAQRSGAGLWAGVGPSSAGGLGELGSTAGERGQPKGAGRGAGGRGQGPTTGGRGEALRLVLWLPRGGSSERAVPGHFMALCRVPAIRHSAKAFYLFFKKNALPSASNLALGKAWFFFKKTYSLPSVPWSGIRQSLYFFLKKRKIHIFFVFLNFWSSASRSSTRQSLSSDIFLETLFFTECHLTGPRQRLFLSCIYLFAECHNKTLGKVFFVYKLFSFLFTHYSDMHAKFWHIS
jgi:hypothetical protein